MSYRIYITTITLESIKNEIPLFTSTMYFF